METPQAVSAGNPRRSRTFYLVAPFVARLSGITYRDEDAAPFASSQDLSVVALTRGVVQQEHGAGAETTAFAIARRQLEYAGEGDAELASRRRVPRPCPARGKAREHEFFCRDSFGQVHHWAAGDEIRGDKAGLDVLEMRLAVGPGIDSWITDGGNESPQFSAHCAVA